LIAANISPLSFSFKRHAWLLFFATPPSTCRLIEPSMIDAARFSSAQKTPQDTALIIGGEPPFHATAAAVALPRITPRHQPH